MNAYQPRQSAFISVEAKMSLIVGILSADVRCALRVDPMVALRCE